MLVILYLFFSLFLSNSRLLGSQLKIVTKKTDGSLELSARQVEFYQLKFNIVVGVDRRDFVGQTRGFRFASPLRCTV